MANRIDTSMHVVQAAGANSTSHGACVESGASKLVERHHAVLPGGNHRYRQVACDDLLSHTDNKSSQPRILPLG